MGLLKNIATLLPSTTILHPVSTVERIGAEITFYPQDTGERYIDKGYKLNDAVYSIVSTNMEKAGQVRMYHSKVKKNERKTLQEYNQLTKGSVNDRQLKELAKMRKAMTEERIVNSRLTKLLNKPTRWQNQSSWIEQAFALRELQGEVNIWLNKGQGTTPLELMVIPKPHLTLVGNGSDPWEILYYYFHINAEQYRWEKEDVVRWVYTNPSPISTNLQHLRGQAPLEAGMINVQAMNEGDKRVATSNKHGGASGLLTREDVQQMPSIEQLTSMRQQVNDSVNSAEMANKIAMLAGKWNYHSFAVSVEQQKLLEQYGVGFKRLCRIFNTPAGIFDEGNATYDNQKQFFRQWIFRKIAPNMYDFRDLLSNALIPAFGLDPATDFIDADIMSLPELSEDLKDQVAALKDASWLSDNEKRDATGYEPKASKEMDLTAREYEAQGITGDLNEEEDLLND